MHGGKLPKWRPFLDIDLSASYNACSGRQRQKFSRIVSARAEITDLRHRRRDQPEGADRERPLSSERPSSVLIHRGSGARAPSSVSSRRSRELCDDYPIGCGKKARHRIKQRDDQRFGLVVLDENTSLVERVLADVGVDLRGAPAFPSGRRRLVLADTSRRAPLFGGQTRTFSFEEVKCLGYRAPPRSRSVSRHALGAVSTWRLRSATDGRGDDLGLVWR